MVVKNQIQTAVSGFIMYSILKPEILTGLTDVTPFPKGGRRTWWGSAQHQFSPWLRIKSGWSFVFLPEKRHSGCESSAERHFDPSIFTLRGLNETGRATFKALHTQDIWLGHREPHGATAEARYSFRVCPRKDSVTVWSDVPTTH